MIISIENLDMVLEDIIDEQKIKQAMGKACALLEREAKENTNGVFNHPTGTLKRSIESRVEVSNGEVIGEVYTPLEYAPYVEYGTGLFAENGNGRKDVPWHYQDEEGNWHSTKGQKPKPFMRPALDDNRQKVVDIIKEGLLK